MSIRVIGLSGYRLSGMSDGGFGFFWVVRSGLLRRFCLGGFALNGVLLAMTLLGGLRGIRVIGLSVIGLSGYRGGVMGASVFFGWFAQDCFVGFLLLAFGNMGSPRNDPSWGAAGNSGYRLWDYRVIGLWGYRIIGLSGYRVVGLSGCRVIGLSGASPFGGWFARDCRASLAMTPPGGAVGGVGVLGAAGFPIAGLLWE